MIVIPDNLLQKKGKVLDIYTEGGVKNIFQVGDGKYILKQFKKTNFPAPTANNISNSLQINKRFYINMPETFVCQHKEEIVVFQEFIKGLLLKDIDSAAYSKKLIEEMKVILRSSQKALLHGYISDIRGTIGFDHRNTKRNFFQKLNNLYDNYDICNSTNFIFDGENCYFVDCESVSTLFERTSIHSKIKYIVLSIIYYLIIQIHLYELDEKLKHT